MADLKTDDWVNYLAGIGTMKDKGAQGFFARTYALPDEELSALYYGNAIAQKIVYKIPELIHQAGYDVTAKHAKEARDVAKRVELDAKILEAHWQARLFGAAAGILLADDGQSPEKPLNVANIKTFAGLNVVDRRYLLVHSRVSDVLSQGFGEPEVIEVLPQPFANGLSQQGARVHVSRMLLFYGQRVDKRELTAARGFGYSVLQVLYNQLRKGDQAMSSLGSMLLEASVSVFKIKDLIAQLTSPNRDIFLERMRVANEQKSTMNSVMVDADKEDYTRVNSGFGGVAESVDRVFQYVASAADYPMTVLFGTSPAGMNATGESDMRNFYNKVGSVRADNVEPPLRRAYEIVFASLGFIGEAFEIEPGPIETMTPLQEAAYSKAVADVYAVHITNDVLTPESVALALFGNGYNPQAIPTVDVQALKAALMPQDILPQGTKLELTPSDIANVTLVWEARESVGKPPLMLPDGTRNPDNDLTVAAFKAKNAAEPTTDPGAPAAPEEPGDGA